jgi:hypothetical protein
MRLIAFLWMAGFFILAGCSDTNGSLQGGGNEGAGFGHIKIGVPF